MKSTMARIENVLNGLPWLYTEVRRDLVDAFKKEFKPDYCTQNSGDCSTCSLVNYGRDCMNNPVEKRGG